MSAKPPDLAVPWSAEAMAKRAAMRPLAKIYAINRAWARGQANPAAVEVNGRDVDRANGQYPVRTEHVLKDINL